MGRSAPGALRAAAWVPSARRWRLRRARPASKSAPTPRWRTCIVTRDGTRRRRGARERRRDSCAHRRHQSDPKRTYLKLIERSDLDAIDPDIHTYAKNFKIRGSSGKLNIALDGLPHFAGLPQEASWGTIDIGGDFDYIEHAFDDYKYGRWSKRPFLDCVIPTTVDPTMAPPGKHFMSVFVQYVPYALAEGPWSPEMRAQYREGRARYHRGQLRPASAS